MASKTRDITIEQKATGADKYLNDIFTMMKYMDNVMISDKVTRFNSTEIRLIGQILAFRYVGKRLISTQLAQLLGVTRSAVSQIVNHLESEGILRRVPDDVDRKIAYIEVTEEILSTYKKDLELCVEFANKVVAEFGEERFESMYFMFQNFCDILEKMAATMKKEHQNN